MRRRKGFFNMRRRKGFFNMRRRKGFFNMQTQRKRFYFRKHSIVLGKITCNNITIGKTKQNFVPFKIVPTFFLFFYYLLFVLDNLLPPVPPIWGKGGHVPLYPPCMNKFDILLVISNFSKLFRNFKHFYRNY